MNDGKSFIHDVLHSADEAWLTGDRNKVAIMVQLAYDYYEVLPAEGDRSEWARR